MSERGSNPRYPTFQAGNFNHFTRAPALKEAEEEDEEGQVI